MVLATPSSCLSQMLSIMHLLCFKLHLQFGPQLTPANIVPIMCHAAIDTVAIMVTKINFLNIMELVMMMAEMTETKYICK